MANPERIELQRQQTTGNRLDDNFDGLIVNPLRNLSDEDLFNDVEEFVRTEILGPSESLQSDHGRDVLRLFIKGATIARNPPRWRAVEELTPAETTALENERTHFFRQPWKLYLTFITCSLGACVQGWDQTGINAANLRWPVELGLPCDPKPIQYRNYVLLFGFVNASTYFAASLIGTWLADPINNALKLGRRGAIFASALFSLVTVIGSAGAQSWPGLLICRLLLGIGIGSKASTVPLLMAENSPPSVRGSLVMGWQMFDAFGIFLGYSANLILNNVVYFPAWRLQAGSAIVPTIPLLCLIYLCPESPRWYIKHGRFADAFKSARALRNTDLQAARDTYFMHRQIEVEYQYLQRKYRQIAGEGAIRKESYARRFRELLTIPRVRRATVAANIVMLAQQLCGINILSFYSATFFTQALSNDSGNQCPSATEPVNLQALWYGWGTGLANFLFTFPAIRSIDKFGRRNLLLWTFPNMAWSMLATGLSTLASDHSVNEGLVIFFSMVFVAFYSVGEGPVPFTYSAEAFPLSHREVGMGGAVSTNFFFAGVLSLVFPLMNSSMHPAGALGLFAAFNVIAFVLIFLFVPETAECSLEDLDYIFGVPTGKHARHQRDLLAHRLTRPSRRGERPNLYRTADEVATFETRRPSGDVSVGGDERSDVHRPEMSRASDVSPSRRPSVPDDVSIATSEGDKRNGTFNGANGANGAGR